MRRPIMKAPRQWGRLRRAVGVWLVLTLAFGTVVVPEAWATEYFVNTTGNDANAGTSPAAPWKTLTYALGQTVATDVIHLAAGTYDTPGNGETFPLQLKDGVTIMGDPTNPGSVVISAPAGSNVFDNGGTPLSASTRLAGVKLQHDAATNWPLMEFAVANNVVTPQIDHNIFAGNGQNDDGIYYWDDDSGDGTFTPTIDNNTFSDLDTAVLLTMSMNGGSGDNFSPVITNNTFSGCDIPIYYSMVSTAEGTVGGLVQGNTFTNTNDNDIYIDFSPSYSRGLLFNPTITGNSMQSGASTNIEADLEGYSCSGNVTFAPTITKNTMDGQSYNVDMSGYYDYIDGDYTIAPTISGNTMTGSGSAAVMLSVTTLSVSSSAERNVLSPTITNNTITSNAGEGIWVSLSDWSYGRIEGTATIAGNSITGADYGIDWEMSEMSDGDGMDWSIVISNNTITSPTSDGIYFSMESMSFSSTGGSTFNLTMDGNTITGAGSNGIDAYPAYSWYSYNQVAETVLVRGNTVTGSAIDGIWLYFSDQTNNTLDARITDNVLQNNGDDGLEVESNDLGSNGILVACNLITGNTGNGVEAGGGNDPPGDYGGGNLASPGNNVFMNNGFFDFQNGNPGPLKAENNYWGSTNATTIDSHIRDDEEWGKGAVDFDPFLSAQPTASLASTLTDSVMVDVAPSGPSVGDTLLYTAVISSNGTCGDASASFTAPVDPNTSVVSGSVTTTRGIVLAEDPPTVAIGPLGSPDTVTVTWQVVPNAGAGGTISTQGTIASTKTGNTLTDDPDVPGTQDPTQTYIVNPSAGTLQFAQASYDVNEGAGSVTLDVTRVGGSSGQLMVSYATADGTAVAPGDYTHMSWGLIWPDGDTSNQQIVIPVTDDQTAEGDETFTVSIYAPLGGAALGSPSQVTVTIHDNDQATAIPTLGSWGIIMLVGLLMLLGFGIIRRRRAAAALVAVIALGLALPASARQKVKPPRPKPERHVTTVASVSSGPETLTISLADGTKLTVPRRLVKVRKAHIRQEKGAVRAQAARTALNDAERMERRRARKAARANDLTLLKPGAAVISTVKRGRDGKIRRVKIQVYDSPEAAQKAVARRETARAAKRAKRIAPVN